MIINTALLLLTTWFNTDFASTGASKPWRSSPRTWSQSRPCPFSPLPLSFKMGVLPPHIFQFIYCRWWVSPYFGRDKLPSSVEYVMRNTIINITKFARICNRTFFGDSAPYVYVTFLCKTVQRWSLNSRRIYRNEESDDSNLIEIERWLRRKHWEI